MQKKEPKYEDGLLYWQCSKCKQWLPAAEYYSDKKGANHLKAQCKKCHCKTSILTRDKENTRRLGRESMRRQRQSDPERFKDRDRIASRKRIKNEKTKAREILNNAVRSGKVIKPTNCSLCGKLRKITAHHDDYLRPLQVRWLCYECHSNH